MVTMPACCAEHKRANIDTATENPERPGTGILPRAALQKLTLSPPTYLIHVIGVLKFKSNLITFYKSFKHVVKIICRIVLVGKYHFLLRSALQHLLKLSGGKFRYSSLFHYIKIRKKSGFVKQSSVHGYRNDISAKYIKLCFQQEEKKKKKNKITAIR